MTGGSGNASVFCCSVQVRGHAVIVLKFGGTSVGTVDKVRDAAGIIEQQPQPRAAIVSAASGVTNMLLEAAGLAANGDHGGAAVEATRATAAAPSRSPDARPAARSVGAAHSGGWYLASSR